MKLEAAEASVEFCLTLLTQNHHPILILLRNAALSSFEPRVYSCSVSAHVSVLEFDTCWWCSGAIFYLSR
jgi:hypothetical protein